MEMPVWAEAMHDHVHRYIPTLSARKKMATPMDAEASAATMISTKRERFL